MSTSLISEFCVRLASGLACAMLITAPRQVGVQFFRTVTLVVLGLAVLAVLFGPGLEGMPGPLLLAASALAFAGSVVWTLGRVRAAQVLTTGLAGCLFVALTWSAWQALAASQYGRAAGSALDQVSSSLVLGSVVAAMLLGHSYLIAPAMSIDPLKRLVLCLVGSIAVRVVVELGWSLTMYRAAATSSTPTLTGPDGMWILARWVIGLAGPAVLGWMVWQTARMRATQSATGILYAAVVLSFFGELLGDLLRRPG